MSGYLLISSRDPFECGDTESFYRLAADLKAKGRDVTLFLVQNGVLPAREGAENSGLRKALGAGVQVLADDFSLRERALDKSALINGVKEAPLDRVVDALAAGTKTFWH
jgi:predicted peroxiredoxin